MEASRGVMEMFRKPWSGLLRQREENAEPSGDEDASLDGNGVSGGRRMRRMGCRR